MTNLEFFKACFSSEMKATLDTIRAIPADQLEYTPHPINRTAYEIAEHIAAHVFDFGIILQNDTCDAKRSCINSAADSFASSIDSSTSL